MIKHSSISIIFIVLSILWIGCELSEDDQSSATLVTRGNSAEVSIADSARACQVDEDCSLISTGCDGCCQTSAINKAYVEQYWTEFNQVCSSYRGGVCDCLPISYIPECKNQLCHSTVTIDEDSTPSE